MTKLLYILCLMVSTSAFAKEKIALSWEEVEEASAYEVKVNDKILNKVVDRKKVKEAAIELELPPGNYTLQIRSFDSRGVPGVWGEEQEFSMALDLVQAIFPKINETIESLNAEEKTVKFQWNKLDKAKRYNIKILDDKDELVHQKFTEDTFIELNLKAGKYYKWAIVALLPNQELDENIVTEFSNFFVNGPQLATPKVIVQETADDLRNLIFQVNSGTQKISLKIRALESGLFAKENSEFSFELDNYKPFDISEFPEGLYKVEAIAHAKYRKSSDSFSEEMLFSKGNKVSFPSKLEKKIEYRYPKVSKLNSKLSIRAGQSSFDGNIKIGSSSGSSQISVDESSKGNSIEFDYVFENNHQFSFRRVKLDSVNDDDGISLREIVFQYNSEKLRKFLSGSYFRIGIAGKDSQYEVITGTYSGQSQSLSANGLDLGVGYLVKWSDSFSSSLELSYIKMNYDEEQFTIIENRNASDFLLYRMTHSWSFTKSLAMDLLLFGLDYKSYTYEYRPGFDNLMTNSTAVNHIGLGLSYIF